MFKLINYLDIQKATYYVTWSLITDILLILPMNKVNYFLCISWCWIVFLTIALHYQQFHMMKKSKTGKIFKF